MGKTRGVHETTPEVRNRMVGMYEAGLGLREISTAVNCSVSNFLKKNMRSKMDIFRNCFLFFVAKNGKKMAKQI